MGSRKPLQTETRKNYRLRDNIGVQRLKLAEKISLLHFVFPANRYRIIPIFIVPAQFSFESLYFPIFTELAATKIARVHESFRFVSFLTYIF